MNLLLTVCGLQQINEILLELAAEILDVAARVFSD
jgi:hypothetical protein